MSLSLIGIRDAVAEQLSALVEDGVASRIVTVERADSKTAITDAAVPNEATIFVAINPPDTLTIPSPGQSYTGNAIVSIAIATASVQRANTIAVTALEAVLKLLRRLPGGNIDCQRIAGFELVGEGREVMVILTEWTTPYQITRYDNTTTRGVTS